jgi:hypothetical protein
VRAAFDQHKVATQGRAMLVVPLHPKLPCLVILWAPVCGAFSADEYVLPQWRRVDELLIKHFAPIGLFQTGKASDGASTRRKPQNARMRSTVGVRYGLDYPGFTMTGVAVRKACFDVLPTCIDDQDHIHCGKKLLSPLDHPSRELMIGKYCAHLHAIRLVMSQFEFHEHGLWKTDCRRRGKNAMDWSSAVRLVSDGPLRCLQAVVDSKRTIEATGLLWYLRLCREYVGMFQERSLSPDERVERAWYLITTLRCWRMWVVNESGLTLKRNFITRECFLDVILSCFSLILTLMAIRDVTS